MPCAKVLHGAPASTYALCCMHAEPVIGGLPQQLGSTSGIGSQQGLPGTASSLQQQQSQQGSALPSQQLISLSSNETLGRRRMMAAAHAPASPLGPPAQDYGVCGGSGSSCPLTDRRAHFSGCPHCVSSVSSVCAWAM